MYEPEPGGTARSRADHTYGYADALRDGDSIRGVILGSAVNNDGSHKVGFTAPSIQGQAAVIRSALAIADVAPATIGYVETHGTGTPRPPPGWTLSR